MIPVNVKKELILENLFRHVKEKKIIRCSQRGFTKRKSFLTNFVIFYDEMNGLVKEGRTVDIVFLHFSKAFSTTSH